MPSGFNDDVVDRVLDKVVGATADSSLVGVTTLYLDFLTTAPSDDNGTGAVSWAQGRASVPVVDGTQWPAASGRSKTGAVITMPANSSGAPIDVVALAWYTASTGGTYVGGGPVPGATVTIPAGDVPEVTATLSAPSPS